MSKKILFDSEAINGLKAGVDYLANSVKVTLGPSGRNVIIDVPYGDPNVTKDGVTVARDVDLEDPLENMGARLVKSVAIRTNSEVGDGTTTATVLAQCLIDEGLKTLSAGSNPVLIKRGMDLALNTVVEQLEKISLKSTSKAKLRNIATVSANNDQKIGDLIVETFWKVKADGTINIEESPSGKTYQEFSTGMKFKSTIASNFFLKDQILEKSYIKQAVVALFIGNIETKEQILPVLNQGKALNKPILLVCNEINPLLLQSVQQQHMKGQFDITIMSTPLFGDYSVQAMDDIALLTGATVLNQHQGDDFRTFTTSMFGQATNLVVTPESFALSNPKHDKAAVNKFVKHLREKLDKINDPLDKKDVEERIARFYGGIATIYVGGNSKVEIKEVMDRVEDSKNAVFAAARGGLVPGGGMALFRCRKAVQKLSSKVPEIEKGIRIVEKSLSAPLKQILVNAGLEPGEVIADISPLGKNFGMNGLTGEIEDLVKGGIVDPKDVTVAAITSAVSVAGTMLTTGCALVDVTNFDSKQINISKS